MRHTVVLLIGLMSNLVFAEGHEHGSPTNEQVVKNAYSTFAAGDMEAWRDLHSDDLSFTIYGDLPQSGTHHGTDAVIANVFEVIPQYWPGFSLEHISIDSVDDKVYVVNRMTAEGLDTYALHLFTLEGGKIKTFTAFDDTDSLRSAMTGAPQ